MSATVLEYEMLQTDICDDEGEIYIGYGIRVFEYCNEIENNMLELKNLFTDMGRAEELIDLLFRNCVSSLHIHDVIEDFLG